MEIALEDEGRNLSDDCSTLLLAIDLLIASSGAKRVAFLDEPSVLPCAGNDAYGPVPVGELALPLEAYECPQFSLTFIQQRSPILKGMMVEFAKFFASFISSIGKKHVIFLSSLDSGRRKRIDDTSCMQIHYISSASDNGTDTRCEELGYRRLEEYKSSQGRWKHLIHLAVGNSVQEDMLDFEDELVDDDYYASLPFAALFTCCKAKGLKVTCLLCYCSEGDNMSDSFQLADAARRLMGLSPDEFHGNEPGGWTIPLSWKTVYGPPPDFSIF